MLKGCEYDVCQIDMEQVMDELQRWYAECKRSGGLENDLRLSMLESFEEIILDAIVEED